MILTAKQAQLYLEQAIELNKQGSYAEALALLEQATPVFEAAEDWEGVVKCLNQHSECLWRSGKYEDGINKAEQALQICMKNLGEWHPDTARSYNSFALLYSVKGDYHQSILYHQKALAIRLSIMGEQHPDTATSYNNLGVCYDKIGNHDTAISHYEHALAIRLAILGNQHPNTASSYNNLGVCYCNKGDYNRAITYYRQTLDVYSHNWGQEHSSVVAPLMNIGICYFEKGDYDSAIRYYQHALGTQLITLGEQNIITTTCYNNLGNVYRIKGDYARAINHHQKALTIRLARLGEQHTQTANSFNNLGLCYFEIDDYDKAAAYLQQALYIKLTTLGELHHSTANSYNNVASCYNKKSDYEQAITYQWRALNINLATFGKKHPLTSLFYSNLAQCYHNQAQYRQALHYLQQALQALALSVPDEDYYPLPTLHGYNNVVVLLEILYAKAGTLHALYTHEQNPQNLIAAIAHYHCADELIGQMRRGYKTEGSKVQLAEKSKNKVYDPGLDTLFDYEQLVRTNTAGVVTLSGFNTALGYQLPDRPIDLAFHFSEKSKAVLLFTNLQDAEARMNALLPPHLVQQEYNLRVELAYLERRISEQGYKKPEEQDAAALKEWQSQHFDYKNQYEALIELLEAEYPRYYELKYKATVVDIAQIQAVLPPKTAMLNYVLSEKYLYTIVITAQGCHWLQTALPADFEGLMKDFFISFDNIGRRDYITYGYDLYRHLLLPCREWWQDAEQLIIIPDGILSKLPFEGLLTQTCPNSAAWQNLPYLVSRYCISYHYSATLWHKQQTEQTASKGKGFIGFAPVYDDAIDDQQHDPNLHLDDDFYEKTGIPKPQVAHRLQYATKAGATVRSKVEGRDCTKLLYSETEVRQVGKLFTQKQEPPKVLVHKYATLDRFKELAGNYRYILIAAHADYDDKKPDQTGIIFSPNPSNGKGILYMGDAYNLHLQAELVVLSCCETGLGKIHKGEGTMALNRGFLFSGAKNVIYTLFKVNDEASCELSIELFRQLTAEQPIPDALHRAKLKLISSGIRPIKWAGYVLVGR